VPEFLLDGGNEDAAPHWDATRELSEVVSEKKTPHEYREVPGDHSWQYWDQQVKEVSKVAAQKLKALSQHSRTTSAPRLRRT